MLNYQIPNFMSIASLRRLKTLDTHPNFQLKLSQLFINQISTSIRFQSDFAIITHGNDSTVNIYLCDQSYTSIQKSLTILNVQSLEDLKVKYNQVSGQILIVYRKKNEIQLIKKNINEDKRISFSDSDIRLTINERYHCVPFQQQAHIVNISDIVQTPDNKIYCLITVASGKVYMASVINQKLEIHNTKQENMFVQYLKNITIRFKQQTLWSHKTCYTHSQVIRHSSSSPQLYALFLIDGQLYMKYFGYLGSQSREIDSWQLNQYENPLLVNCQIINCIFAPLQNEYEVELFVLCCVDNWKIVLYIMTINMKQRIKSVKTINNVFKNDQRMQSEDEPTLHYHKELDHIDIEYFNNKVYLLLSKNTRANSLISKKVHYLAEVSKHQSQWSYCQFQMLQTSDGQLRMIKTKRPKRFQGMNEIQNQKYQSLLFIGESNCYSYQTDIQSYEEQCNLERMFEMSQSRRTPPPIPKYTQKERDPTSTYAPKPMPMTMPVAVPQDKKKEHDYLNPFSKQKIDKYIEKKEYGSLFNLFNIEKQQFYKQLSSTNYGNFNGQSLRKNLFILVILKIFTIQKGLKPSLQVERIKTILTKFSENDPNFLPNIFVDKKVEALPRIFKCLLESKQSKQYRLLYQICTQTIPNFMQMLFQGNKKSMENKQQENKMESEDKNSQKSQCFSLFPEYFQLYQNLANVLPNKKMQEKQQFNQYQHKQFLDKYFQMQSIIELRTEKQQKLMLQQNKKMIRSYIQNSDKMIKKFISFAIKYSNIGIFQDFILQRFVTKQDMCQFVNENQKHSQDLIIRLYIDLINTEIAFISNFRKKHHRGLHVLDWVPKQYQTHIFHFLQDHYPILALVYGLTIMPRRQLATKLEQRLKDLDNFTTAEQLLTVIAPLYSVACPEIKVNIDMALLLFEKDKKFISYNQLTARAFGVSPIQSQRWLQFKSKCSKYLSQQQIDQIKINLKIN